MRQGIVGIIVVFMVFFAAGVRAELNLTGTFLSGDNQVALIEGQMYHVGDEISGCEITNIDDLGITVTKHGKSRRILVANANKSDPLYSVKSKTTRSVGTDDGYVVILSISLLIIGFIIVLIGEIWFLVVAFRAGIWWGLGCFFIQLVDLIFLIVHWRDAKKPFAISLLGGLFVAGAIFLAPEIYQDYSP